MAILLGVANVFVAAEPATGCWWLLLVRSFVVAVCLVPDMVLSVARLMDSHKKLKDDEEDAEEALFVLQQQLSTAVNRLSRIRKIRKRVEERSKELVRRGMQELDEEDGVSRSLESEDCFIVQHLQDLGAPGDADWAAFGLGDAVLGPSLLVGPGSGGETLQASAGSASNA
jgi:hypothetical protein